MNFEFSKSFEKSLDKLRDKKLKDAIANIVVQISDASSLTEIKNIKKLAGYKTAYRIKVLTDYRIGVVFQNNIVYIVDFAHRKEIYKKFP